MEEILTIATINSNDSKMNKETNMHSTIIITNDTTMNMDINNMDTYDMDINNMDTYDMDINNMDADPSMNQLLW